MKRRGLVERILADRPLDELLALDWTQTNVMIGRLLAVSLDVAGELRRHLRAWGLPVPSTSPGRRRGSGTGHARYVAAGLGKRSDTQVARTLGVSHQAVASMRQKLGMGSPVDVLRKKNAARREAIFQKIGPRLHALSKRGLTRDEMARTLGLPIRLVAEAAQRFHVPRPTRPGSPNWSTVDWSLANVEIARSRGIRSDLVAAKRCQLRRRDPSVPRSPIPARIAREKSVARLLEKIRPLAGKTIRVATIAKALRLDRHRVKRILIEHGLPFRARRGRPPSSEEA